MQIEAVTVCVNYADFLQETLPRLIPQVTRLIVVTTPNDKETIRLCRKYGVICRPTDLLNKDDDPFAKARGIDYGLAYCRQDSWILHIDADIAVPPLMKSWLEWTKLNEECIYGVDRVNCTNYDDWQKYKLETHDVGALQHDHWCLVTPPTFPLGSRIAIRDYEGYIPIGYWQLWHGKHNRRYPLLQSSAERTDVLHAIQWESENRRLLPNFFVIHLESEPRATMGVNWQGRKTKRFGPLRANNSVATNYGKTGEI